MPLVAAAVVMSDDADIDAIYVLQSFTGQFRNLVYLQGFTHTQHALDTA